MIARFADRYDGWIDRFKVSSLAKQLIKRIIRLTIILIGFILALELLDATAIVGAVLGLAGLAGLAVDVVNIGRLFDDRVGRDGVVGLGAHCAGAEEAACHECGADQSGTNALVHDVLVSVWGSVSVGLTWTIKEVPGQRSTTQNHKIR